MKKLLCFLLLATAAWSQSPPSGSYYVPNYAYGLGGPSTGGRIFTGNSSTGVTTITLYSALIALPNGHSIMPYATNAKITVGTGATQETVTPTVISGCYLGAPIGSCRLTANFTFTHGQGEFIATATFGLQEAINDATSQGGGNLVVDSTWGGTTSLILNANGNLNVTITDNRTGTQVYVWNGANYQVSAANGNGAVTSATTPGIFQTPVVNSNGVLNFAFITNFPANSVFGNCTGSSATPSNCSITAAMLPGSITSNTSGTAAGLSSNIAESQVTNLPTDLLDLAFKGGAGNSFQDVGEIAAPANPSSGQRWFANSTTHTMDCHISTGASCLPSTASVVFSGVTGGTNTGAAMVVGTGASLGFTGTGTINANQYNGVSSVTGAEFGFVHGVTSAIQTQLNALAPLASPALTGTPTAPTQATADNSTALATDAYVKNNLASYLTSAVASSTYLPISNPSITGNLTLGAASTGCLQANAGVVTILGANCGSGSGGSPGGTGSEVQFRSGVSSFGAVTGSSVSGANVTLAGTLTVSPTAATVVGLKLNLPGTSTSDTLEACGIDTIPGCFVVNNSGEAIFQAGTSGTSGSGSYIVFPGVEDSSNARVGEHIFNGTQDEEFDGAQWQKYAMSNVANTFGKLNTFLQPDALTPAQVLQAAASPNQNLINIINNTGAVQGAIGCQTSDVNCPGSFGIYAPFLGTAGAVGTAGVEGMVAGTDPGLPSSNNANLAAMFAWVGPASFPGGTGYNVELPGTEPTTGQSLQISGGASHLFQSAWVSPPTFASLAPGSATSGALIVGNGTTWANFAGNNSGTLCFTENATGVAAWAACGSGGSTNWNTIGNPAGNLSLTMAANTSLFTYNATTGANDLFKLTDTLNNTGTGAILHPTTASGSAVTPFQADANGAGVKVNTAGALLPVGGGTVTEVGSCNQANLTAVSMTNASFTNVFSCSIPANTLAKVGGCIQASVFYHAATNQATTKMQWVFGTGNPGITSANINTTFAQSVFLVCETGANAQYLVTQIGYNGTAALLPPAAITDTETTSGAITLSFQGECSAACTETIKPDALLVQSIQ